MQAARTPLSRWIAGSGGQLAQSAAVLAQIGIDSPGSGEASLGQAV